MRLGVLGGTFDPPHYGHLILAEQAREQLALDLVLWVPAADPPHKQDKPITAVEHRVEMVTFAIAGNPAFQLSSVDISRAGPHYTLDMLRLLREQFQPAELFFLIGEDSLRDIVTWHEPGLIVREARLGVMARPGVDTDLAELEEAVPGLRDAVVWVEAPLIAISGTDIRTRVAAGRSIRYLLPFPVHYHIRQNRLYQD